jgi:hypothetical protein
MTAASVQAAERRRQAVAVSHTSSGTTQTQWWVQDIGETSRPVTAQHASPASLYPRRCAQIATARPARPTASTAISHHRCGASLVPASLATTPDSDWSDGLAGSPIRFWSPKTPPSQNVRDGPGSPPNPAATVTAKVPAATAAARSRPVSAR